MHRLRLTECMPTLAILLREREIGNKTLLRDHDRFDEDLYCYEHNSRKSDCVFTTRIWECLMLDSDEREDVWMAGIHQRILAEERRQLLVSTKAITLR